MYLISEPPIDPPCERFTYAECPTCKEFFTSYDELHGENPFMRFAWWDTDEESPCCSEWCCEKLEDDCGHDWEDEFESEEVEQLKREAKKRYA